MGRWIGVDLDGTLAHYDGYKGVDHIGAPIRPMIERVKQWLAEGKEVRIFTARVDGGTAAINLGNSAGAEFKNIEAVKKPIREWCKRHLGVELLITNAKDYGMIELWDDRCIQLIPNTGLPVGPTQLKTFWVSWWSGYDADEGCTEPPFKFWETGLRARAFDEGKHDSSFCALIHAGSVDDVWALIQKHFRKYEYRFCDEKPQGWTPPGDRFK